MADSRNLEYLRGNEGNGWDAKYSVAASDAANIEVEEISRGNRKVVKVYNYGTAISTLAGGLPYKGFPIATLLVNMADGTMIVKTAAAGTNAWKPVTLGTALA